MRTLGIQHRVKKTAAGDAHPTRVCVIEGDSVTEYKLETEQDELDFLEGRFATEFRPATPEEIEADPALQGAKHPKVATAFDGLRAGDTVGMALGGSGDYLAFALARKGRQLGATLRRLPTFVLKNERKQETKDGDHILLARLVREKPELFYDFQDMDGNLILVRESWRSLWEAMQARMACEQRVRQSYIGRIFTDPDGLFPEGGIEKGFDTVKASDPILAALVKEERKRMLALEKALAELPVFVNLLSEVEGLGPKIAARIISAVIDIRRFPSSAKLKAYMGAHVLEDGRFPRRRRSEVANWHGDARQALFLLGDQFNKRAGSEWGKRLRANKLRLRATHPVPVLDPATGKKRYTDGHIHKMATWRTISQFVVWLYDEWRKLEKREMPLDLAA